MMAPTQSRGTALHRVRALITAEQATGLTDPELLGRFMAARDEGAFAALVKRHGPLVLGVCRRVLGNLTDAEDAFQATFLVLARKAAAIANQSSLPCWLYQVAYHTAAKARARKASRRAHEARAERQAGADPLAEVTGRELLSVLDEELQRLPERNRAPLVLCYLEGKTRDEAARELGWSLGTLKRRLEQGRDRLRQRLTRRGLALPGTLLVAGLCSDGATAAVPGTLADAAVRTALAGPGALAGRAAVAAALARGTLRELFAVRLRTAAVLVSLAAAAALGVACLLPAQAPPPAAAVKGDAKPQAPVPARGEKREVTVTGRVLDADGKPVKGARVGVMAVPESWEKLAGPDGERMLALEHTATDKDGNYRLPAPRPTGKEPYPTMLIARAPGHGLGLMPLPAGARPTADIRLPREQVRRGRLIDLQGAPVKGLTLRIAFVALQQGDKRMGVAPPTAPWPLWFEPVTTDAQGRFRLTGLGPEHEVGALVRDVRFNSEVLQLWRTPEQRAREMTHVLTAAQWVEGRVTFADTGKPASGAEVRLNGNRTRTDKDGRYRFNPMRGTGGGITGVLSVQPPRDRPYLGMTAFLEAPKASALRQTANFTLPRGVMVTGIVKEAGSGKPVAGAEVYSFAQQEGNPHYVAYAAVGPVFAVTSDRDGCFQIVVVPGPGHLVVKGPTPAYVPVEIGRRQLDENKPGGVRHFAHGLLRTDFKPDDGPRAVELTLRRGAPVRGTLTGPDGAAVTGAAMLTRLSTSAPMRIEEVRGVTLPGAAFELPGCDPDRAYPVVFLHEKKRLGALVQVSGKQTGTPLAVRLQPCGAAKVRFLDKEGQPLAGHWAEVEMVFAPGPSRYDGESARRGVLAADTVSLSNIHRHGYQLARGRTDEQGRITLEALVPGVTYRIVSLRFSNRALREFTVRPGETVDLKDVKLAVQ
jgi:RNA polymerase sigma factor (sigma-70 family)